MPSTVCVGIYSPGEMGAAVAGALRKEGIRVLAWLEGRSARTISLATGAGMETVATAEELVSASDVLLSILVPSRAEQAAQELLPAMHSCSHPAHFVDCNAVSPKTVQRIGNTVQLSGAAFSDASFIGLPPTSESRPRLYVSGPEASTLVDLDGGGFEVRDLGSEVGQASALKMTYAALTKGSFALYFALAMAAARMGTLVPLLDEFAESQPAAHKRLMNVLPKLPPKAHRWFGEMEEIAASFEDVGVTGDFHHAAAQLYRAISATTLGQETPESVDAARSLSEVIEVLCEQFPEEGGHEN